MADRIDELLNRLEGEMGPDGYLMRLTSRMHIQSFVESLVEEALGKSNPAPVTREAGPADTLRPLEK